MTDITTNLNTISEALNKAVSAIEDVQVALFKQANAEKAELLAILGRMQKTQYNIKALSKLCGDTGATLLDIAEIGDDISDKIHNVLLDTGDIPAGIYETFVDFCETCGKELHEDDVFVSDGMFVHTCMDCVEKAAKAEADALATAETAVNA